MKLKDLKKLKSGDQVFFTDPVNKSNSRLFTINKIKIKGKIVYITGKDGTYLEAWSSELS